MTPDEACELIDAWAENPRLNDWRAYLLGKIGEMYGVDPGKGDFSARIVLSRDIRYGTILRGKASGSVLMVTGPSVLKDHWRAVVVNPSTKIDFTHQVGQRLTIRDLDKYEVLEA